MNIKVIFSSVIVIVTVFAGSLLAGTYSGGAGEPNDPYLISDVNDINEMRGEPNDWGSCFLMTADIDLAGAGDNPDGSFSTAVIAPDTSSGGAFQGVAFTGVFDGDGYKITALTINDGGACNDYLGLYMRVVTTFCPFLFNDEFRFCVFLTRLSGRRSFWR